MTEKQDFAEFKVVVSNDEKKVIRKFPTYHNGIQLSHDDPLIKEMVELTLSDFGVTPEEIVVHIKYMWEIDGST